MELPIYVSVLSNECYSYNSTFDYQQNWEGFEKCLERFGQIQHVRKQGILWSHYQRNEIILHGNILHFGLWTLFEEEVIAYHLNAKKTSKTCTNSSVIDETIRILEDNEVKILLVLQDREAFYTKTSCLPICHLTDAWYKFNTEIDFVELWEFPTPENCLSSKAFKKAVSNLPELDTLLQRNALSVSAPGLRQGFHYVSEIFSDEVYDKIQRRIHTHARDLVPASHYEHYIRVSFLVMRHGPVKNGSIIHLTC